MCQGRYSTFDLRIRAVEAVGRGLAVGQTNEKSPPVRIGLPAIFVEIGRRGGVSGYRYVSQLLEPGATTFRIEQPRERWRGSHCGSRWESTQNDVLVRPVGG